MPPRRKNMPNPPGPPPPSRPRRRPGGHPPAPPGDRQRPSSSAPGAPDPPTQGIAVRSGPGADFDTHIGDVDPVSTLPGRAHKPAPGTLAIAGAGASKIGQSGDPAQRFVNPLGTPQEKPARPRQPIELGLTGTPVLGGMILADPNVEMNFPRSVAIYDRMRRTDGQVKGALLAITLPILSLDWDIEPFRTSIDEGGQLAEPTPEALEHAEFVKQDLINGMTTSWKNVLRQLLGMLWAGFWVLEPVYEIRDDDLVHLRKLGSRTPASIGRWIIKRDGGLNGLIQRAINPATGVTEEVQLAAADVLVFTHDKEGADWTGISVLRSSYKHFYYKDGLYRIGVINAERGGGFPVITLPEDAVDSDLRAAHEVGESIHVHERAYVICPPGWEFKLETGATRASDLMVQIQHHDEKISASIMAQFMNLGTTETGSRALGGEFLNFFLMAEEAVIYNIEDTINTYLLKPWLDMNFPEIQGYPKLKAQNVRGFDPRKMGDVLQAFVTGKMISPDEPLEAFLRKMMGLPEADLTTRREGPAPPGAPGGSPFGAPPGAPGDPGDLTPEEAAIQEALGIDPNDPASVDPKAAAALEAAAKLKAKTPPPKKGVNPFAKQLTEPLSGDFGLAAPLPPVSRRPMPDPAQLPPPGPPPERPYASANPRPSWQRGTPTKPAAAPKSYTTIFGGPPEPVDKDAKGKKAEPPPNVTVKARKDGSVEAPPIRATDRALAKASLEALLRDRVTITEHPETGQIVVKAMGSATTAALTVTQTDAWTVTVSSFWSGASGGGSTHHPMRHEDAAASHEALASAFAGVLLYAVQADAQQVRFSGHVPPQLADWLEQMRGESVTGEHDGSVAHMIQVPMALNKFTGWWNTTSPMARAADATAPVPPPVLPTQAPGQAQSAQAAPGAPSPPGRGPMPQGNPNAAPAARTAPVPPPGDRHAAEIRFRLGEPDPDDPDDPDA